MVTEAEVVSAWRELQLWRVAYVDTIFEDVEVHRAAHASLVNAHNKLISLGVALCKD